MPIPSTSIVTRGIASVLSTTRLEVPLHQRPFEWTEQVGELLEDIEGAFGRNKEEYFLGSLVVTAARDGERPKVLDGQQRLAVISLLLASIANQFEDRGEARSAVEVRREYLAKYHIKQGIELSQLKLNYLDDDYFHSVLNKIATEPVQGAPESHLRLWQACQYISDWLARKLDTVEDPISWLADFTQYLDESAYVVYFMVADDANAFLIFETMNDRGLDLSIADLLKNYLLGRAGQDLNTILNRWTTAIAYLNAYGGEYLFTVFLRHFWSSKYGLVREKDLYRSIKSRISTVANVRDFSTELEQNSYNYAAILSPDHEFWSEATSKTREYISTLSNLGLEQYRPMLLSALAHLQPEALENLLRLLISWNVRLLIVGGLGGGTIENLYCGIAKSIRNGELKSVKEVANHAKSFIPNDALFKERFAVAHVSKAYLARYYLRQLELEAKGKSQRELAPITDPSELNLEHIMPERPAENTWLQFSEEDRNAYTKRLGNMLLLKEKMNSKLRNSPFDAKRDIYKESELLLTKAVAKCDEWNKKAIEERQRDLAELAVKAWSIEP